MKKKNRLTVAGAMTAPMVAQADAVLYGNTHTTLKPVRSTYWDWRAVSRQMNRRRQ